MGAKRPSKPGRDALPPIIDHGWIPDLELSAHGDRLVAKVDLPGLRPRDVMVEVTDGHLSITGERQRDAGGVPAICYRCERAFGPFYRAIPLPAGVRVDDVTAVLADGVLEVTVPYPACNGARAIAIEAPAGTPRAGRDGAADGGTAPHG